MIYLEQCTSPQIVDVHRIFRGFLSGLAGQCAVTVVGCLTCVVAVCGVFNVCCDCCGMFNVCGGCVWGGCVWDV